MERLLKREISIKFILTLIRNSFFTIRRGNTSLWVALLGISVGVCSLVSVTGIMNGMQKLLVDKLVQIESYDYQGTADYDSILHTINELNDNSQIEIAVPFVDEFIFIETPNYSQVLHMRALDVSQMNKDSLFLQSLSLSTDRNKTYLGKNQNHMPKIIIGWNLSGILDANIGDVVSIILPGAGSSFLPKRISMQISDIFYSQSEYDSQWGFVSLDNYMEIMENTIEHVQLGVRVNSHRGIESILEKHLEDVASWQEKNSVFVVALKTEKSILLILTAVIFCIIVLHFRFAMMRRIKNKKDDIVSLRTMGATPNQIIYWFLGETIVLNLFGTILGVVFGLGIIFGYDFIVDMAYNWFGAILDVGIYRGAISVREILLIVMFTWTTLLWASRMVVRKSAHIVPMEVIRYE